MKYNRKVDANMLASDMSYSSEKLDESIQDVSTITVDLTGEAPNFNLQETVVKEKNLRKNIKPRLISPTNSENNKKNKQHIGLAKIDRLILKELTDDYLKVSIPFQNDSEKQINIEKFDATKEIPDSSDKKEKINDTIQEKSLLKKRNKWLRKLFGRSKEERKVIEKQEAEQREELRKKINFVLAKDKIEELQNDKVVKNNITDTINVGDTKKDEEIKTPIEAIENIDNFEEKEETEALKEILGEHGTNKIDEKDNNTENLEPQKAVRFGFKNEIKQLEFKLSDLDLILGKNILPDRLKRKKHTSNYAEPKEELSEIDKLYLSAFSDVSLPDDDFLPEEDTIFLDDPVELEELFNLADSSLTDSMENAILTEINSLKQDLEESLKTEKNGIAQVTQESNQELKQKKPVEEVRIEASLNSKKDFKQRITRKIKKKSIEKDKTSECQTANFFVKFSAFVVDFIILAFVSALFSLFTISSNANFLKFSQDPLFLIDFSTLFLKSLLLLSIAYYTIVFTLFQTSLGLGLLSYQIKSTDNKKPKIRQILVRIFCMPITFLSLIEIFKTTGLHERLSKTKLVRV